MGPDPEKGELRGHARGIIAIGDFATGVLAVGGLARGIVAMGGLALGALVGVGGVCVGALALGGWRSAGSRWAARRWGSSPSAVAQPAITLWAVAPSASTSSTGCGRTRKPFGFSASGCRGLSIFPRVGAEIYPAFASGIPNPNRRIR